jgi:hypothetical protein
MTNHQLFAGCPRKTKKKSVDTTIGTKSTLPYLSERILILHIGERKEMTNVITTNIL